MIEVYLVIAVVFLIAALVIFFQRSRIKTLKTKNKVLETELEAAKKIAKKDKKIEEELNEEIKRIDNLTEPELDVELNSMF